LVWWILVEMSVIFTFFNMDILAVGAVIGFTFRPIDIVERLTGDPFPVSLLGSVAQSDPAVCVQVIHKLVFLLRCNCDQIAVHRSAIISGPIPAPGRIDDQIPMTVLRIQDPGDIGWRGR